MDLQLPTRMDRLMHAVAEHRPLRAALRISMHDVPVLVESSSIALIQALRAQLGVEPLRAGELGAAAAEGEPAARVVLIEGRAPDLGLEYRPWPRDLQYAGAREEVVEIDGGRVVRDPRSGLTYLLGPDLTLSVGPCSEQLPRVLELIHAAVIERLVARGALACRAAGVALAGRALVIAGPPRSGKTSLALSLAEHGAQLLGLERVLLRPAGAEHSVLGFADGACLQPGSLLASSVLAQLLSAEQRAALTRLPASDLWALQQPRELSALELRRVLDQPPPSAAALAGIVSLAWQPASFGRCELRRTTLDACPELVSWLAKRAGPLCRTGAVAPRAPLTDLGPYLQRLGGVAVWELRGGVDFALARALCHELACS